jgi:integrator complex subunit 6
LHPSLRAFCDVTGGHHATVQNVSNITPLTELLARLIAPQIPSEWPLSNPLQLPHLTPPIISKPSNRNDENRNIFVNAGPICSFQQFESTPTGPASPIHRAMLLYTPTMNITNDSTTTKTTQPQPPIWCIPEMYFPSKKLDTLPPRSAQPILNFVRQYQDAGMNTFDPLHIMKLLHRLEQVVSSNRNIVHGNNTKPLLQIFQCDVYMCQWLNQSEGEIHYPKTQKGQEHFPVCVRDAGRSLCEGDENVLNIGILHVPHNTPIKGKHSTLTLMPPDAHILLPLLLKVAEVENRALKKALEKRSSMDNEQAKKNLLAISRNILIDENWYSEFRAYLFRLPPYYMFSIKRCLHQLLPSRCQALVSIESVGSVVSQCFSKQCLQKIKHGEQISRENIDRLERKEEEYRNNILDIQDNKGGEESGYGHFDKRSQTSNYLNALRQMPPPWKLGSKKRPRSDSIEQRNSASKSATDR